MPDITSRPASGAGLTRVEADVTVSVVAPGGQRGTGRLLGHGQHLRLELDRPEIAGAFIRRRDIGRAALLLANAGITASVIGPRGQLAELGAGVSSRAGAVVTGSAAVAITPSRDTLRIGLAVLRTRSAAALVTLRQARNRGSRQP